MQIVKIVADIVSCFYKDIIITETNGETLQFYDISNACRDVKDLFHRMLASIFFYFYNPFYENTLENENNIILKFQNLPDLPLLLKDVVGEVIDIWLAGWDGKHFYYNQNICSSDLNGDGVSFETLLGMIKFPISEVREESISAILKKISHFKTSSTTLPSLSMFSTEEFLIELLALLAVEKEPSVLNKLLELIKSLIRSDDITDTTVKEIFRQDTFSYLLNIVFQNEMQNENGSKAITISPRHCSCCGIEILGYLIKYIVVDSINVQQNIEKTQSSFDMIDKWMVLVEDGCSETQDRDTRESIAHSLVASEILSITAFPGGSHILLPKMKNHINLTVIFIKCWLVALTLLQDDDNTVREIMNQCCFKALSVSQDTNRHFSTSTEMFTLKNSTEYVIDVVSRSIDAANEFEKDTLQNNQSTITQKVMDDMINVLLKSFYSKFEEKKYHLEMFTYTKAFMCSKIFEKDPDNLYIERLEAGYPLCIMIAKMFKLCSRHGFISILDKYIPKVWSIGQDAEEVLVKSISECVVYYDWLGVGGSTYQPDIYSAIILSFYLVRETANHLLHEEKLPAVKNNVIENINSAQRRLHLIKKQLHEKVGLLHPQLQNEIDKIIDIKPQ